MSKIDDLIKQYCPNGVEYKELGDICNFKRGKTITAKDIIWGDVPVIAGGQKPAYYHNEANRFGETIVVSSSGAYAGYVSYWTIPVFLSDSFSVEPKQSLITKYVFYFLKNLQNKIYTLKKGSGVPHVHGSDLAKLIIPVPPLPVQEEIVKVLDAFTALEAELEAELEARKRQYEYYRNKLLTFDENTTGGGRIKFMQLGEVAVIQRGKRLTKPQLLQDGLYPVFHGGIEPLGYYNQKNRESDTVMVINVGASAGTVGYSPVDFWSSDGCFCISHSKLFLNKYLYHTLKTKEAFLQSKVRKAGIPTLDNSVVEKVVVAIPPLDEQERIVAILDKFDSLVNDISEGLPAELTARRQQYEYYRNKLLTFDEVA